VIGGQVLIKGFGNNKLGVHALVWVGGWSDEECESAIAQTKAAGYDLIEMVALDPSKLDITHTRETLQKHGIEGACSLGLGESNDINSEDMATVKKGEETLLGALKFVEGVGGNFLGGVIHSALKKYDHETTPKARANSVAVIKQLAQEAQKSGITICLEPVNRYETNLLNTAQQTIDFINDVGEQNVMVHLDIYHCNIEEDGYRNPILTCGDRLGYVHIGESHRGYLGTGTNDFETFFSALKEVDYGGAITFESFSSAVVDPKLSMMLGVWRNLWSDSMDLAVKAREFMQNSISQAR
jgi:D-psicose/D-tagatose/L-ribulose 3-epimerase